MSGTLISLLAVTIGFGGLLLWVYWPGNKEELESLGSMPLEDIQEDIREQGSASPHQRSAKGSNS